MAVSIKRTDYVRALVQQGGLTYVQAERTYMVLMALFADALASQKAITIGRVGVLKPRQVKPRIVRMGFKRDKNGMEKVRREYHIGMRTKYVFKVRKTFAARCGLAS